MKTYIYGKHPVAEALRWRSDTLECVYVNYAEQPEIDALAKKNGVRREAFDEKWLVKKLGEGAVHQGVAAIIDTDTLMCKLEDVLGAALAEHAALVILGEVQDPQNAGSIIRSAAAFGLSGVLIPRDRQVQITGSVIKASAGAAFSIPLVSIGNVNQTIATLKKKHFWVYGLAGEAEKSIRDEDFAGHSVFIVGNEGRGIREKTEEHCDIMLKIPIARSVESLNAGMSAAIAFYEWRAKQ